MRDLIGHTLGHYRIVDKIGEGGMGVVYRAHDERLDRDVAVKVLPEEVAQSPDRLARFEREAKSVAQLDHPNILAIHDYGTENGVTYAVMELLEGESLRELISKGGITISKAVEYARAIADGLAVAHDKGIIHRDLKPENVFLTADGRIKILDFGLAKLLQPEVELATETPTATLDTVPGGLLGTVAYMAPEQLQGTTADQRSDIFALGAVLYEMLAGRRPFSGATTAEVAAGILERDPEPVPESVPPTLRTVISKCLEKRPEDRFSSAHDLSLILGSVDSKATTPFPREKAFLQRHWPYLAVVAVGAVIALMFLLPSENLFKRSVEQPIDAAVPRIVVLPFENLGSPEDEYFADGVTEEITSRLASVRGLGVISRTSAMQYKGRRPSIQKIAEDLDVDYVLEGTVRWERVSDGPDRMRITPQLIRVEQDTHLWSERYDRVMGAVFAVQSEIAWQVVSNLNVVLLETEKAELEAQPTSNIEAYQTYLLAQNYGYQTEQLEDLELAISLFERATNLDPHFALAYVALAEIHSQMIHYRYDTSPARHGKALEASDKALAVAPDLPEAHRARGYYYYWALRDYDRALGDFSLAVDGKPGDTRAIAGIGWVLRRQGRMSESLTYGEKVINIDPKNARMKWDIGATFFFLRDYEKATENIERALKMAPNLIETYYRLAWAYRLWDGTPERARASLAPIQGNSNPVAIYACLIQDLYERDYKAALNRLRSAQVRLFELPRQLLPSSLAECECLLGLGKTEDARLACEDARGFLVSELEQHPDDPRIHSALGKTYALLGYKAEAVRYGEKAVDIWPISKDALDGVYFEIDLAEIYAIAGEHEAAVDTVEHLLSIPSLVSVPDLRSNPMWDPLRNNPRFQALLEKYDTN